MLAYFPRHHVFHHAPPTEFLTRATTCGGIFFPEIIEFRTGFVVAKPFAFIFDDVCCARKKIKDDNNRATKTAFLCQASRVSQAFSLKML